MAGSGSSKEMADEDLENYKFYRGANWTEENIRTLISWLHTSAVMLDLTREATAYYRNLMRRSTIINLIFSSIAGTVSLSQFNGVTENTIETVLKAFFSGASILIALNTGYIKVYQIQERLESTIQLQQQWSNFGSLITSELQLPIPLRKDALQIITKMKETYHHLIRDHVDINRSILEKVALRNGISPQQLTITDLFERVIVEEMSRLKAENGDEESIIVIDEEQGKPVVAAQLKRTSRRFFENNNRKQLQKLETNARNTRVQVANLVLSPGSRLTSNPRTSYSKVLAELNQYKSQDDSDSAISSAVSIISEEERNKN